MTAQEQFARLTPAQQQAHTEAWARVESLVRGLVPAGAKVFEAEHAVIHARRLYHAEMAKGMCAFDCERTVRKVYT
jgi:hypothetical protein